IQVLYLGELRRGGEQVARAFDELVLLRGGQAGEVERLLGDRPFALLASLHEVLHLQREYRQRREQDQDQKAKAELHRRPVTARRHPRPEREGPGRLFRIRWRTGANLIVLLRGRVASASHQIGLARVPTTSG